MQATEANTGLLLDGHTSSEENPNNLRFSSEPIKGSPFSAVMQDDKWCITWGMWRVSDMLESREEVDIYMEEQKWNLMCAYMVALQQAARRYDKETEKTPEEVELEEAIVKVENSITN